MKFFCKQIVCRAEKIRFDPNEALKVDLLMNG